MTRICKPIKDMKTYHIIDDMNTLLIIYSHDYG